MTDLVPITNTDTDSAVTAAILYGRELGLGPMTALQSVHVIKGTPSITAQMMRGLILAAGHDLEVTDATNTRAVVRGRRAGGTDWQEASYSMDDAKAANLAGQPQYRARPQEMLVARATTRLARRMFADVIGGLSGVEEHDMDETTTPTPKPVRTARRAAIGPSTPQTTPGEPPKPGVQTVAAAERTPNTQPPVLELPPLPPTSDTTSPTDVTEEPQMVTNRQLTAIAAAAAAAGYTDRESKLRLCAAFVNRPLESSKQLTRAEAGTILDTLKLAEQSGDAAAYLDRLTNPPE